MARTTTYSSPMNRMVRLSLAAGLASLASIAASAQKGVPPTAVIVAGHPMVSDHDIMDNLSQSPEHTVFLGLLRIAGMVEALQAHGPFTVFAPTDAAFAALPTGLVEMLRRPENKPALVALLSEQILPGNFSSARLRYLLRASKGSVDVETVSDSKVTFMTNGPSNLVVRDPKGNVADIVIYDAKQANGVVFITDRVLQPG